MDTGESTPTGSQRRVVRRGLLAGGILGVVASLLGRARPAAASHSFWPLGAVSQETETTELRYEPARPRSGPGVFVRSTAGAAFAGFARNPDAALDASSEAVSASIGLYGEGDTGGGWFAAGGGDQTKIADFFRTMTGASVSAVTADEAKVAALLAHAAGGYALDVRHGKTRLATVRTAVAPPGQDSFVVLDNHVTQGSLIAAQFIEDPDHALFSWFELLVGLGFRGHLTHRLRRPTRFRYVIVDEGMLPADR